MGTRRVGLALLVLLLPVAGHADRHKIGGRGAVADARRSNLWGLGTSLDFPLVLERDTPVPESGEKHTFSAIVELGIVWGTHDGEHLTQFTYLSGLRYSLKEAPWKDGEISLQGLVGGWHSSRGEVRDLPVAALGLGLYFPITKEEWGISLQFDRYFPQGPPAAYTQVSLGVVYRRDKQ